MSDSPMRCAMTGIEIRNSGDGVWDDGEWISWTYLNGELDRQENGPLPTEAIEDEFDDDEYEPSLELLNRVHIARNHHDHTLDGISPDWGRIGEDYMAERFGVELCRRKNAQGHDGRLGDDMIEIKTITPHKGRAFVQVKREGNFNVLAVVRITENYGFDARFIRRSRLSRGDGGKWMVVAWSTACRIGTRRWKPDMV